MSKMKIGWFEMALGYLAIWLFASSHAVMAFVEHEWDNMILYSVLCLFATVKGFWTWGAWILSVDWRFKGVREAITQDNQHGTVREPVVFEERPRTIPIRVGRNG